MTIRNRSDRDYSFSLQEIDKTMVIKKIRNLEIKKELLSGNHLTLIIKEFDNLLAIYIIEKFNLYRNKGELPEFM